MKSRSVVALFIIVVCYDAILLLIDVRLGALDCRLFYSPHDIGRILASQGSSGRDTYWLTEWVDIVFIFLYSALLIRLASFARNSLSSAARWPIILAALPGLFDLVETSGVLILLSEYPRISPRVALLVAGATPMKWATLALATIYIGTGLTHHWRRPR